MAPLNPEDGTGVPRTLVIAGRSFDINISTVSGWCSERS